MFINIFNKKRKENKELACSLARQIRAESPKVNQSEIKRLFNIALNLKSIEENKVEAKFISTTATASHAKIMSRGIGGMAARPKMMMCKKVPAPIVMMASLDNCKMAFESNSIFGVDQGMANRINAKAQLFKEEGKSKEYCETQYYNKVYKNTDSKSIISPNHFFADLAKYWSENDSLRNIGFRTDNILIKPENLKQILFILSVLDLEEKTLPQSQNLEKDKGHGLTIESNGNAYLLTKEINSKKKSNQNFG